MSSDFPVEGSQLTSNLDFGIILEELDELIVILGSIGSG